MKSNGIPVVYGRTRGLPKGLKSTFGDKEIEIIVSEVSETDYLLKSEANKKRLLQAVENVKNRTNLVEVNLE
ncbi:MAG: hypothetical protein AB4352_13430 [Hormoscilla sp.]